jgi:F-type H+-transporting ATPase subunit c
MYMGLDLFSLSSLVSVLAADDVSNGKGIMTLGVGLGVGLASLGAAFGIGRLAAAAVESMARQPEVAGQVRGAMVLTAAFIEGVCLFSVVVSLLAIIL